MNYDYKSKNLGRDLIYENRLKIAKKLGVNPEKVGSSRLYSYIMEAEMGIILN